jgi:protein involved in polysaccharide export with SLBB domain
MKTFALAGILTVCTLLTGCGLGGSSRPAPTAGPTVMDPHPDLIRVGDKITVRVSGTPDVPSFAEVQIPATGQIQMDLLTGMFQAAGRTPAQLSTDIAAAYRDQKIYTNPDVVVLPEERYVNVGGEVRGPARVAYSADSTVMTAIESCGGFTEYANRRAVRIIRGQQVIQVDCVRAISNPGTDPPVYPGDQIYVPRTIF